jgi:hypothetical protein
LALIENRLAAIEADIKTIKESMATKLWVFGQTFVLLGGSATAIGFYRNQGGWMKIAALLDHPAKAARELAHRRAN